MSGRSHDDAKDWHDDAEAMLRALGIDALSPMRANEFLKKTDVIDANGVYHPFLTTDSAITTRDLNDVMRCDAVLMNLLGATRISIGCMIEAGWAHAFRKPVVLMIEPSGPHLDTQDHPANVHEHPILRSIAGYRVSNLDDGIEAIHYVVPRGH